jgi:hypothetical protein
MLAGFSFSPAQKVHAAEKTREWWASHPEHRVRIVEGRRAYWAKWRAARTPVLVSTPTVEHPTEKPPEPESLKPDPSPALIKFTESIPSLPFIDDPTPGPEKPPITPELHATPLARSNQASADLTRAERAAWFKKDRAKRIRIEQEALAAATHIPLSILSPREPDLDPNVAALHTYESRVRLTPKSRSRSAESPE